MKKKLEKFLANYSSNDEINESLLERFSEDWDQLKESITEEDEKLGEEDYAKLSFRISYLSLLFSKSLGREVRNFAQEFAEMI